MSHIVFLNITYRASESKTFWTYASNASSSGHSLLINFKWKTLYIKIIIIRIIIFTTVVVVDDVFVDDDVVVVVVVV